MLERRSRTKEKEFALLLRNEFNMEGEEDIPIIKKQEIDLSDLKLIGIGSVRHRETKENKNKVVHFFEYDYRFKRVYEDPPGMVNRLKQYRAVLSPDFSLYQDMPRVLQKVSVFKNRWCGAYYQRLGIKVIPTISWSDEKSFEYCFKGVEEGSIVAVSTVGVLRAC